MWTFLRLLIAALAFAFKLWRRRWRGTEAGTLQGLPYYELFHTSRRGDITDTQIGIPFTSPVLFRLQPETKWDRFFKAIGISRELQTGDTEFDARVYIVSDQPDLLKTIAESARARRAVRAIFNKGFRRIESDGQKLWILTRGELRGDIRSVELLHRLRSELLPLEDAKAIRRPDPFQRKILVIEALLWSLVAYVTTASVEMALLAQDIYLDKSQLWRDGLITSAVLFVLLLGAISLALRGSARRHGVIIESVVLLLLALPVGGTLFLSDLNRSLDRSAPITVTRTVAGRQVQPYRSYRGTAYDRYHLFFADSERIGDIALPPSIEVSRSLYRELSAMPEGQRRVRFEISPGWLKHSWYRKIEVEAVSP